MLLIEHFVAPSSVDGLGVFAGCDVAKGTKVYEFHPLIDREIAEVQLDQFPAHIVAIVKRHSSYIEDRRVFRLSADGDHYMNHSDDPNVEDCGDEMFACRDIRAGEELLCDYRATRVMTFDPDRDGRFRLRVRSE